MKTTPKLLLAASILCFVVGLVFVAGFVHVDKHVELYIVLPLSPVFFGLFLLAHMFEKEIADFDRDQQKVHGGGARFAANRSASLSQPPTAH